MKGVIAGIAPSARVIDLTHGVPPQDVETGAFALASSYTYFPAGSIHLAVVDPGVGSARRAIALAAGGYYWVAPDNGLLGYALASLARADALGGRWQAGTWELAADAVAVSLEASEYWLPTVSRTFHGRDLFAPVAAHLANGTPLAALGPSVATIQALGWPSATRRGEEWEGEVVYVDQYGNLITNLENSLVASGDWALEIGAAVIRGLSASYAALPGLGALPGSSGHVEIAVRNGSAARELGLHKHAPLILRRLS